jgi:uncharacterized protein
MSENVEIVRRANVCLKNGDRDGALADYHPDVEWRDLQHAPDTPECVHGVSAIRALWDQWEQAFDEFNANIEEFVDAGDRVVTLTRWRAQGKGSGLALDLRTADVFELAGKRIVRVTMGYTDMAAALEAVGLADG